MNKDLFTSLNMRTLCAWAALASIAGIGVPAQSADEESTRTATIISKADEPAGPAAEERVLIQRVETSDEPEGQAEREMPWLGVSTEEASEALAAQLGLNSGEGLTVTYIAPESPAAKAGLEKNDVLVEFDGQSLVHPAQLRKLIQRHKEGDAVQITYYRAGKKETAKVTIGKTSRRLGFFNEEHSLQGNLRELQRELEKNAGAARENLKGLRESLEKSGIDRQIKVEVRRSMEEVRKALQEAMRHVTNAQHTFGPAAREFQELARRGLGVEKDATVVVKSNRDSVQSIVKTDDTGTYVVVADPKKQLTAHDKSGKLLFDGPIETEEQQAKVPAEVMEKVKPMLEQLKNKEGKPAAEAESE